MGQLFRSVVGLAIIATASSAPAQTADQIARGAKAFGEQKCSMCHAIAGKGNAKGALDDVGARLSGAEIREWLVDPDTMRTKAHAERKPLMKSFAKLSKDDLDGLVAYLQSLKTK
jgi:mono/diheme cytochrome c family protein